MKPAANYALLRFVCKISSVRSKIQQCSTLGDRAFARAANDDNLPMSYFACLLVVLNNCKLIGNGINTQS